MINHVGPPTENTIIIPPSKNSMPILYAADMCFVFVNLIANHAPNNVPNACARNGKMKCSKDILLIANFKPASVEISKPLGVGKTNIPVSTSSIFSVPPSINPRRTIPMSFTNCMLNV